MKKIFSVLAASVLFASAVAGAKVRMDLVGRWTLNGQPFCAFKADGTGSMNEESFRWTAEGGTLTLTGEEGSDQVPYRLEGGRLYLSLGGMELALDRSGKSASDAGSGQQRASERSGSDTRGREPSAAAKSGGGDRLETLLLSSAWCSFSYNKYSGTTQTSQVRFYRDGTWSRGARRETYSSGDNGTYAGQHDSQDGGRWKVQSGQLYLSDAQESPALQPVDLRVTRNSNGHPILIVDGKEYSSCN